MASQTDADQQRAHLARQAIEVATRRSEAVTRAVLAAELNIPRARIEAIFPDEDALFSAIVDEWYADDANFMSEIVASSLPVRRKMFEFFAQRYLRESKRYRADPATFALFIELGREKFELVRGYIELADHHLTEIIAEAQAEGYFPDLSIDRALTLINQMVICYTSPQLMMIIDERLAVDKLATIIDTLFDGLQGTDRGAAATTGL